MSLLLKRSFRFNTTLYVIKCQIKIVMNSTIVSTIYFILSTLTNSVVVGSGESDQCACANQAPPNT